MSALNLFFGINGVLFLIVGLRALLKPVDAVAVPFALEVLGVDGMNYLRSGAGGVAIAGGVVLLAAIWLPPLHLAAVVLFVAMLGGLVAGRLFSVAVDGAPGLAPWISGFFELLGLAFGLYWLNALWPAAIPSP